MIDPESIQTRIPSVLEDPSAQAIARVYADAFLAAAQSAGVDEALEEFQSFVEAVLDRHPKFGDILLSGIVNREEKVAIIDRAIAPHGSELFVNFLRVLARHGRLELIPNILGESRLKHEIAQGWRRVRVTSAHPLTATTLDAIRSRIGDSRAYEPILEPITDPSLIGGLLIQIGDTVYDSSLKTRMRQLRDRLRERSLHEIQSRRDRFSHPEGD